MEGDTKEKACNTNGERASSEAMVNNRVGAVAIGIAGKEAIADPAHEAATVVIEAKVVVEAAGIEPGDVHLEESIWQVQTENKSPPPQL